MHTSAQTTNVRPGSLTSKQIAILKQLYRFRFGTTDLLAKSLGLKDGRYIHTRLETLVNQDFIGKNYDSTYRLNGKPATYYLLPKALRALRHTQDTGGKILSPQTLRNAYRDSQASEAFIARKLAVFTIYSKLHIMYGAGLKFWTKDQLNFHEYEYFPKPKPAAYLSLTPSGVRPRPKKFFLEYLDDTTPFFVHARHLQKYVDYLESESWEDATNTTLRGMLVVCESPELMKRVRKKLAGLVDEDQVPQFCYTTLEAILRATLDDDEIWQTLRDPLRVFSLKDI